VRGHFWTVAGHFTRIWQALPLPASQHVVFPVSDSRFGTVQLTGRLSAPSSATTLLILIHGLGGSSQSPYLSHATTLAHRAGAAVLRLNLRGADLRGEDFYHAGLSKDLHQVIASEVLSGYSQILILGYSLGGHVSLRFAGETNDPRVQRVATLCAPLDLDRGASCFDSGRAALYRAHVLDSLKHMYEIVWQRRKLPLAPQQANTIQRIRDWDERIVAPRHGFQSAVDYYARASAGPHLSKIALPTLIAYTRHDPMVPFETLTDALAARSAQVQTWEIPRGGHIGFPTGQRLFNAPLTVPTAAAQHVDAELVEWLLAC
jgi:predicted alpha/beta-fold hydrolase